MSTTLDDFLTTFIGALADSSFSSHGNLTDYLAKPESDRTGDEANIVDHKITGRLLVALGYQSNEIDYNQQQNNLRADFVIRIVEYPSRACFVVEDKSTTVEKLTIHRPQLMGYMGQHQAPRGFFNNGKSIIVYDQNEGSTQTPSLSISLVEAVDLWQGTSLLAHGYSGRDALEYAGVLPLFAAFWRRFRRESFASVTQLIDDLTLQSTQGNNRPHKTDGTTWKQSLCRIPILSVDETNAPVLTNALKNLISEIEDDANAQLSVIENDYKEYQALSDILPGDSLSLIQREDLLVNDLLALMPSAEADVKISTEEISRKVIRGQIMPSELAIVLKRLYGSHGGKPGNGKDPIKDRCNKIVEFADRRHKHLSILEKQYSETLHVMSYYIAWKEKTSSLVFQSDENNQLRREFLAQTAYLIVIRILLVRIMEDKKLVNRMFTNGGVSLWFCKVEPHYLAHAIGKSAPYLLDMAYSSAQHIYSHFYAEKTVLDWYNPDRNAVIRVLHILAGFDLKNINRDVIGSVYNQYVEAKHKHESGMYFTPPDVANYMLDRVGYKGTTIIGKKLLDLSCGSGGFLVEAARRLVDAHKAHWKIQGHNNIPAERIQDVLDEIRESLHGIDLNPFACALAETNLLIQVIDLFVIARDKQQSASIDRFHIYNSDSLTFSEETIAHFHSSLPFPAHYLPIEDQLKSRVGKWEEGFDFIVGNPPYVKANEEAEGLKEYRDKVKAEYPVACVRDALTKKWDLFIPFVAASNYLLKEGSAFSDAGKAAIITSNAIEIVPYAEGLRKLLVTQSKLSEIHFFNKVKLFEDAAVNNTITVFENSVPSPQHHVTRFWHDEIPQWGTHGKLKSQSLKQLSYLSDVFRKNLPSLKLKENINSVLLSEVFYVSKGMVLNSNEKTNKGAFKMDDLVAIRSSHIHSASFAGSKDVDAFGFNNIRYLEYGPNSRVPSQVSRPTFPELYDRPKMMVGEFGGFAYDDGSWDPAGFLKCNHSVFMLMPWNVLQGVFNKSITGELKENTSRINEYIYNSSRLNPLFVLAYLNSSQMRELLSGVSRSAIEGRLQPDDLRKISIPFPDDEDLIEKVANLANEATLVQKALLSLRQAGWIISDSKVASPMVMADSIPTISFNSACVKWGIVIKDGNVKTSSLTRQDHRLFSGKKEVITIPSTVKVDAVEWLLRQIQSLPSGSIVNEIVNEGLEIPINPSLAASLLNEMIDAENIVKKQLLRIKNLNQ